MKILVARSLQILGFLDNYENQQNLENIKPSKKSLQYLLNFRRSQKNPKFFEISEQLFKNPKFLFAFLEQYSFSSEAGVELLEVCCGDLFETTNLGLV